ncbi:DNA cross-link repair protein [Cordyceps fumosorosea ARSEF 2679]|uniref:DNA cross-link repair protein n=1 Tax=Cordyceps fumosorosea (strain ARSEF 2679) TaxID=1081104 RepID=A0A167ZK91_CORFA|nr:DNA cross-link repair protein [Cordyceps fumosorosea ARSEF 2679]OAA67616.1 DNA cross-link repair protein [Cordyceps fumosorosea ARSEF 2679]
MVPLGNRNRLATPRKSNFAFQTNKKTTKPNGSILTFFQKTEKQEGSLFVGTLPQPNSGDAVATENGADQDLYSHNDETTGPGERQSPKKRRRVSETLHVPVAADSAAPVQTSAAQPPKAKKIISPFIMDSDDEDDPNVEPTVPSPPVKSPSAPLAVDDDKAPVKVAPVAGDNNHVVADEADRKEPPSLKHEDTSGNFDATDEFGDFEDMEMDMESFEGDEMREWRFMKEQARLEAEESGDMTLFHETFGEDPFQEDGTAPSCPICSASLVAVSEDEASKHVNACLDGNPTPLPKPVEQPEPPTEVEEVTAAEVGKRFMRAAIPRPGQANPFDLTGQRSSGKSAFSQLMSNNAEDTAWSTAAAAETASRGRPAYMRTCPFYKIMPGFSICVDAFRYGAVEGCKAYFLSHFHSDHYIGLTANWTHGPIYCSKVTGSLVRNQLRTAAKWVVELDFDKEYDVPGTDGAKVTMIPANHCPGSSLLLFEKVVGERHNKSVKRILHCGDFRACPDHVEHPLLRPDVADTVTGKLKRQKIDICYLDTTYLNPRYSFPPQSDVIQACAEMVTKISPDPNCKDDIWDSVKKDAGKAVSKYFQNPSTAEPEKPETKKKLGQRLLIVCGTYSIGKERICVAIAKALRTKIFASPSKIKICKQLGDAELTSLLTSNPIEAQVHMQMLMEIRAETLQEYLNSYKPHFSRIVGFRPSGWNFRPVSSKAVGANAAPSTIPTQQLLHGRSWRTRFGVADFAPQRGSTKEAMCLGVPYSEHSSFRELALFLMSVRVDKVIPTVNVGSEQSRRRMKAWTDKWLAERRKGGLVQPLVEGRDDADNLKVALWDGKSSNGGGAWW